MIAITILPKPTRLKYSIIYIPSIDIRLVEQVFDVHVQQIYLLFIQIIILHDTFKKIYQRHFSNLKGGQTTIDDTPCEKIGIYAS